MWAFPFYEKYFKGIPFVLRAHNVEANVSKEQQGLQGKFLQFQSKSLAKIEQYVFNQADEIWCISETDKQAIEQKGFNKADVLPLDLTIQDLSSSPSTKIRLGFIGAMNWGQTKRQLNGF